MNKPVKATITFEDGSEAEVEFNPPKPSKSSGRPNCHIELRHNNPDGKRYFFSGNYTEMKS